MRSRMLGMLGLTSVCLATVCGACGSSGDDTDGGGTGGSGGSGGSHNEGGSKDATHDTKGGDVSSGDVSSDTVSKDGSQGMESGLACGTPIDGGEAFGPCGGGATCCGGGAIHTYYCTPVTDAGCPKVP
jgi:hypothetical protein